MEPVTLCGAIILMFGLWVEFEPRLRALAKAVFGTPFFKSLLPHPVQQPVPVKRMPICFAKASHY